MSFSCTKTLNITPISTITSTNFWKTEDDATGALNGMYAAFRDGVAAKNLFMWGEARSQDMEQSVGNDFTDLPIFTNTLNSTKAGPDWSSLYKVVNDANLLLKNVSTIPFKLQDDKDRILAEAYTMRAFCYFVMARTWGAVPLVTNPTEGYDPSIIYKERSSVQDVFTLIKKDIDSALTLYPDNNFPAGRDMWCKPAAEALKGDVYLWTGKVLNGGDTDFRIALNALDAVDSSDVSLLPNFSNIFSYDNKGNNEIIMASHFELNEANQTFMVNLGSGKFPPNVSPESVAALGGGVSGEDYWTLTDNTLNKFSNDDQRKNASFVEIYTKDPSTGQYTDLYTVAEHKFPGIVNGGEREFLDDVIIYRYGGVLLLKAEAENALGMDPSAAINEVRERAYGSNFVRHIFVPGSQAFNDSVILNERLLELLYEGKRWWDLIRFHQVFEQVPYFEAHPNDKYMLLWPLSLNILSLEPKATQNPGY